MLCNKSGKGKGKCRVSHQLTFCEFVTLTDPFLKLNSCIIHNILQLISAALRYLNRSKKAVSLTSNVFVSLSVGASATPSSDFSERGGAALL